MTDYQRALRGRWAVALMFLANGFVMGAWAPQIPLLLPRHQITESTLGLLILVLGLGAVSAMLFAGRLIGRFGTRTVLRAFALSIVPVLPAVVYSPNIAVLAVAMAALGALIGCMDVAMNASAVASSPENTRSGTSPTMPNAALVRSGAPPGVLLATSGAT